MLLKNTHLLRFPHPSSLRRTSKHASFLRISGALHLGIFEQHEENDSFSNCYGKEGREPEKVGWNLSEWGAETGRLSDLSGCRNGAVVCPTFHSSDLLPHGC